MPDSGLISEQARGITVCALAEAKQAKTIKAVKIIVRETGAKDCSRFIIHLLFFANVGIRVLLTNQRFQIAN